MFRIGEDKGAAFRRVNQEIQGFAFSVSCNNYHQYYHYMRLSSSQSKKKAPPLACWLAIIDKL